MGDLTNNFSRREFTCRCGCGLFNMKWEVVYHLQLIRDHLGIPIGVNCGSRCPAHNISKEVGGVPDSEHIFGEAVDIDISSPVMRFRLIPLAAIYFPRIIIYPTFIHLGASIIKPPGIHLGKEK